MYFVGMNLQKMNSTHFIRLPYLLHFQKKKMSLNSSKIFRQLIKKINTLRCYSKHDEIHIRNF